MKVEERIAILTPKEMREKNIVKAFNNLIYKRSEKIKECELISTRESWIMHEGITQLYTFSNEYEETE